MATGQGEIRADEKRMRGPRMRITEDDVVVVDDDDAHTDEAEV